MSVKEEARKDGVLGEAMDSTSCVDLIKKQDTCHQQ
jgi:hypothetical protein